MDEPVNDDNSHGNMDCKDEEVEENVQASSNEFDDQIDAPGNVQFHNANPGRGRNNNRGKNKNKNGPANQEWSKNNAANQESSKSVPANCVSNIPNVNTIIGNECGHKLAEPDVLYKKMNFNSCNPPKGNEAFYSYYKRYV